MWSEERTQSVCFRRATERRPLRWRHAPKKTTPMPGDESRHPIPGRRPRCDGSIDQGTIVAPVPQSLLRAGHASLTIPFCSGGPPLGRVALFPVGTPIRHSFPPHRACGPDNVPTSTPTHIHTHIPGSLSRSHATRATASERVTGWMVGDGQETCHANKNFGFFLLLWVCYRPVFQLVRIRWKTCCQRECQQQLPLFFGVHFFPPDTSELKRLLLP
jgi:hypothetical protein